MMRRLAISFLVILSGCVTNPAEEQRCSSYSDCPELIGSIKPTEERIQLAKQRGWPIPVHTTPPIYPKLALASRIEGYVVVQFEVTKNGDPANMSISQAYPEGVFEESAIQSVKHFKFEKSSKSYNAIKAKVSYNIN